MVNILTEYLPSEHIEPINIFQKTCMNPWFIKSTKRNLQYEDQHISEIEGFGPYYAYETFILKPLSCNVVLMN